MIRNLRAVAGAGQNEAKRRVRNVRSWLRWVAVTAEFERDALRYRRHASRGSSDFARLSDGQLEAQLIKDYHRIEKGLALAEPKRPFGLEVDARLVKLIDVARNREGIASEHIEHAVSAREALHLWNSVGDVDPRVAPLAGEAVSGEESFFFTRHSVRNFSQRDVDDLTLDAAVLRAIRSPSVCNRQPWLVRFYRGTGAARVLKHQNGNRGFGDRAPVVALVTVDLRAFAGAGERNQAWIEGGIFASTLMWALHDLGLSSCMLNLSVDNTAAQALRRAASLDEFEVPIMMLAVGYAQEEYRYARSPRRDVSAVRIASE